MKERKRVHDDRDDTAAKPSMGGTQKNIQDSTNAEDTRRLYNRPPVSKVQDAKETPGAARRAKEKQLGNNFTGNTN